MAWAKEKAQHGTAAPQNNGNETKKNRKEKNSYPFPLMYLVIFSAWLDGTPCPGKKKQKKLERLSFSPSLVRRPPVSRPPHHRFGTDKALPFPASVSAVARLRESRCSRCGPRSPARQRWCSEFLALPVKTQLGRKNRHRSNSNLERPYRLVRLCLLGGRTLPIRASLVSRGTRNA